MGYMVGYEPYTSGYQIWYPGMHHIEKARDVIFHKDRIAPATLTIYSEDDAPQNVSTPPTAKRLVDIPSEAPTTHLHLFIRIPTSSKQTKYSPEDQDHATIKEVPLDQSQQDETKN